MMHSCRFCITQSRQFAVTIAVPWVIDRLLKNQNPLEKRNNLRAPWFWTDLRGTAPQFCGPNSSTREPWLFGPVRAFDDSTARRSAAAASRGPRLDASRAGWRLRQSHQRLQHSLQPGILPSPSRYFRLQIATRLFRRCPQRVKSRIMPDSRPKP